MSGFRLQTSRTLMRQLDARDAPFMLGLLNDPAWLRYIGDRGVRDVKGAGEYLESRILASYERLGYGLWMVESHPGRQPMGICGLVKRDTLEHVDLGFAFMPEFRGQGIAYESALAVRDYATGPLGLERLLAITTPLNLDSIRLLERLGFGFEREMSWGGDASDPVNVYAYAPRAPGETPANAGCGRSTAR